MASLASRLFEVSPNRSHWLSAFRGSFPTILSSQTQSITPVQPDSSPFTTKEILSLFTTLQTQLFEAVAKLQEILDLQDAKQKVACEIRSKDSAMLSFANKLKEVERILDILIDDYSDYRCPKRSNQKMIRMILAPLRGALPPAPQEEQLRASQLYAFADLDVDSNPLANLTGIQGLIPPNFVIPSGWKPGMPVELPSDLPMMPPLGWKPGDPIPLPPLDTLPIAGRIEEQQPRPIPAQGIPKVPEPVQVRHIRSHAQKYFLKVQKNGTIAHVPPPHPKRKASHPYPQKAPKNVLVLSQASMANPSSLNLLAPGYSPWDDTSMLIHTPLGGIMRSQDEYNLHRVEGMLKSKGFPRISNSSIGAIGSSSRTPPSSELLKQGKQDSLLHGVPDFAEVYTFIGSVFDPDTKGHMQKLKERDPINFETVLLLMRNLTINLSSPDFEPIRKVLSSYDVNTKTIGIAAGNVAKNENNVLSC
ncbi:hypothetical protein ACSBR2_013284 [Camellia fascicularis]